MMDYELFLDAATLLLPDLPEDDERVLMVAQYAKDMYKPYNPSVPIMLLSKEGAETEQIRDFYNFCKKNNIDVGNREVLISNGRVFFTNNYRVDPVIIEI